MKKSDKYNPYEDAGIHMTQETKSNGPIEDRKGFNDVLDHFDAINRHQVPKKLSHFPMQIRGIIRWIIIIGVSAFVFFQAYSFIQTLKLM
jgi:hypothetical protein